MKQEVHLLNVLLWWALSWAIATALWTAKFFSNHVL